MTDAERFTAWSSLPPVEMAGWQMVPWEVNGRTIGVAATSGTEIHFAVDPQWRTRAMTRERVRQFLAPLIEKRGYLTTRAIDPTQPQRDFLRKLGFDMTHEHDSIEHFMLSGLPFAKEH